MRFKQTIAALAVATAGMVLGVGGVATATADVARKAPAGKQKGKKGQKKGKQAPKVTAAASFTGHGSVGEAYVLDAEPGDRLMLVDKKNRIVKTGVADDFGSKIFYSIEPKGGYTVRVKKGGQVYGSSKFAVLEPGDNPPQSFYEGQTLHEGLNYVTMRDGVELAMTVRLPSGKDIDDGPFPTYIEYSGYQTAAPHDLLASVLGGGGSDPLAPATSTAVGGLIGPLLDFATVSVQMRGSGCSGGGFDLFGLPTTYDGYDAVETVAAQPWVKNGKVGMGGISFSGITQLFTAGTQPPHLAAISPLSVTDDVYDATGYPGGIFNKGFALTWITERFEDSRPAPGGGQPWAKEMTTNGDPQVTDPALREDQKQHCLNNQRLRLQTRDVLQLIEKNPYRTPSLFDYRAPGAWVKNIDVPVFWVGQFQDEQTGGHWAQSISKLRASNPNVWVTVQNGVHVDSLGPSTITRWAEFMNLFVADRIPKIPPLVTSMSGVLYDYLADAGALPVEQSRYAEYTSVDEARADFQKDPRVRVMFDNGAAIEGDPGALGAKWELAFGQWPPKEVKPTRYFLGTKGRLVSKKPGAQKQARYTADPAARPAQTLVGAGESDAWKAQPPYNWTPVAAGKGLAFKTAPLSSDAILAGPSSLDLWVKSNKRDTDIQATLTEVRPDGKETYVQNGWLRASHRALYKKRSTVLDPVPTHLEKDAEPLRKGKWSLVRVPIFPVAHAFRAGSSIRVTITAPGGDRPIWDFATVDNGKAKNAIGLGGKRASKIVLPVVKGANALGTPLPPPTALRGQPSRDYVPASNGG